MTAHCHQRPRGRGCGFGFYACLSSVFPQSSLMLVIVTVPGPSPSLIWTAALWLWTTGESHGRSVQGLGSGHISQWGWNPQKALLETVLERFPSCVPVSSFPQAASLSGSPFAVNQTTESSSALFLSLSHQVSHRSLAEACPTAGEDLEASRPSLGVT